MKVEFDNIRSIEKIKRLNLINSVVGVKPVVLVGTTGQNQINNLAIFSSLVHMGSNPPLLALNFRPVNNTKSCLLYTSPSPRDKRQSRMPSSA